MNSGILLLKFYFCEMKTHQHYMQRCIELAKKGLGTTYPNPLVGSVIVYNDKIIGEGWHKKAGEAHAEVNAINSVKDKSLLKKATIYVSLEPCSHFGKTPPCCDLIIKNEIPNVVVGTVDPFAKVAGTGIAKLIAEGKNVTVGVLEEECNELNKRFFTFHTKKRPFIILKWAETANGFIAPETKANTAPVWISNTFSKQMVHKWRTEEQGILIGKYTALDDNPELTARLYKGNNPTRILIDRNLEVPLDFKIKNKEANTIVLNETRNEVVNNITYDTIDFSKKTIQQIVNKLYEHNIQSVIIEGGAASLQHFINANFWDEARVFTGDLAFKNGTKAPELKNGQLVAKQVILKDRLSIYKNV